MQNMKLWRVQLLPPSSSIKVLLPNIFDGEKHEVWNILNTPPIVLNMYACMSVSVCLPVCMSMFCLCVWLFCLSVCLPVSVRVSVCLFCLSNSLHVCMYLKIYITQSLKMMIMNCSCGDFDFRTACSHNSRKEHLSVGKGRELIFGSFSIIYFQPCLIFLHQIKQLWICLPPA